MASAEYTARDTAYWYVPIVRAVPAAFAAIVTTFVADHSPELGFLTFGVFALLSGLTVALLSARTLDRGILRGIFITQGAVSFIAGAVALLWPHAGLGFLLLLVTFWAAVTGFLELYAGVRARGRNASSRDWLFVGGLTAIFAIVILVMPPDFVQHFTGPDNVVRVLSTSVVVVGALGAYGAIVAVYLVIAGLSLKWAPKSAVQDGTAS
ncbi:DUF308 domain-containing protein [Glaciihabitans sp. dw_435]|uniref:DUF308 domain-containing protein n=1 Tax=Glaciihabitans sp. dw_435 TaxID=2720081 RepID=UPI001BD3C7D7|nr:DUF308 domain-containing protein [Glaciihabitans sp. dw_435]